MTPSFSYPVMGPASRTIPSRSKASSRVQVVDTRPCLKHHTVLRLESGLEAACYDQLIANPDVLEIQAQPPKVQYFDGLGKLKSHTFDFLLSMRDRTRVAVAVRPIERVRKWRFDQTLELIAQQMPRSFAASILLFTDADVPRPEIAPHAPATLLIERARELGAPAVSPAHRMMLA